MSMLIEYELAVKLLEIYSKGDNVEGLMISELCKLSLAYKWNIKTCKIDQMCPFCHFSNFAENIDKIKQQLEEDKCTKDDIFLVGHCKCSTCLCPAEICAINASSGYITLLEEKYYTVKDVEEEELQKMIKLFEKYIIKEVKQNDSN